MTTPNRQLADALEYLGTRGTFRPDVALILGSGLGGLADLIEDPTRIAFGDIPGMVASTAGGHAGQFIVGRLEGATVIAMAGRLHRYEGWSNEQVAFPVRLMAALGSRRLIVSNAAGGLNPKLRVGDVLVIRDHINLMTGSPDAPGAANQAARKLGVSNCGVLPPMRHAEVYDDAMCQAALKVAVAQDFDAWEGTYLATLGPTYETRSEYRMMRRLGADVAGMSTVPEVLAALDEKMRILGLSLVSNVARPDVGTTADHQEVLRAGVAAAVKMEAIVRRVIKST